MSIAFYREQELAITFRAEYRKAVFGLFHVAFLDNEDNYVIPSEDKPSIEASLSFYQNFILKGDTYPVYDGKNFYAQPVRDPRVLKQVLGLPDSLYHRLDLSKDILSQITFVDGLKDLKNSCYYLIQRDKKSSWSYRDDFKLFCLNSGVFFLYDETKPFRNREITSLPVFFDESRFDPELKKLYHQATSDRFAIDFLGEKCTNEFVAEMKKYDSFSLQERVDFFLNDRFDARLADLNQDPTFRRKYEFLLREYISSLINFLYDRYCFKVLNKVTSKLSYLTIAKFQSQDHLVYSLSASHADMFSSTGKEETFAFDPQDKEKISLLIDETLKDCPNGSLLTIYSHLGLPYEGYEAIENKEEPFTKESLLASLPFEEKARSSEERFLTAKRYDTFYSYLSGEKEHEIAFLGRRLFEEGVEIISSIPLLEENPTNTFTVRIWNTPKCASLATLFSEDKNVTFSLAEQIYPSYLLFQGLDEQDALKEALKKLDYSSQGKAAAFFFHAFKGITIERAVDLMLVTFDCQEIKSAQLLKFFFYVLLYPLAIVERECRLQAIRENDALILVALDGMPNQFETYEPTLPYPYVSYGKIAYSFRRSFFSKPYLCSSEKNAIERSIQYYSNTYKSLFPKNKKQADENTFILTQIGLPNDIVSNIDFSKPLIPQLPYQDNLCHLCHHTIPTYHPTLTDIPSGRDNAYLTYLFARAAENGVFLSGRILEQNYDLASFYEPLKDGTYTGLFHFDRAYIQPVLLPYVNVSAKMVLALLSAFFPNSLANDTYYSQVVSFLSLGDKTIQRLMFDCRKEDYMLLFSHMMVFTHLVFLYLVIGVAYAYNVSQDIIPPSETEITMNLDYNPRLLYPYVILGRYYNAYTDDLRKGEYYFCSCEKESMLSLAKAFDRTYQQKGYDRKLEAPILLGVVGVPYLVILKYVDFDLSENSVEDLIDAIPFKESICRRCLNVNHAALIQPFTKAFPYKENKEAEYSFAVNRMIHDGFRIFSDYTTPEVRYHPERHYDLSLTLGDNLPFLDYTEDNVPEALFTFFVMSQDTLRNRLYDFAKVGSNNAEAIATASGILLDANLRSPQEILDLMTDDFNKVTKDALLEHFPEIQRVRESFQGPVMQAMIGFFLYLVQELNEKYAELESHVGR
ncbi:MAG: hypothetical protein PUA93_01025 [Eubacteriales bacterium]|nr:hypothetical protein [Eubacteriales bacterium]